MLSSAYPPPPPPPLHHPTPVTVMVCGHADKIRMQVRHVSADGEFKGATLARSSTPPTSTTRAPLTRALLALEAGP